MKKVIYLCPFWALVLKLSDILYHKILPLKSGFWQFFPTGDSSLMQLVEFSPTSGLLFVSELGSDSLTPAECVIMLVSVAMDFLN